MNRKMTATMTHSQKSSIEQGVNNMLTNPTDSYHINNAYLMMLAQNMDNWRLIKTYGIEGKRDCPDYYNQLTIILECMLDLLVDVKPEQEKEYEKLINEFRQEVDGMFISNGQDTYYNRGIATNLQTRMNHCFRGMVKLIDTDGMLRKKSIDPRLAMGDIE